MEKLSIEDKAKAYDEVVKKLSRFIKQGVDPLITRADVQDFFPELCESEDEKIRGYLIRYIDNTMKSSTLKSKLLVWLEKQGTSYTKRDVDDAYLEGMAFAKDELEKQGGSFIQWNKNTEGNKPQVNHSVLMKTTHGIAEGEWQGGYWHQYRWAGIVRDSDVLSWIELSDLE